jgi:hypothetical protein
MKRDAHWLRPEPVHTVAFCSAVMHLREENRIVNALLK